MQWNRHSLTIAAVLAVSLATACSIREDWTTAEFREEFPREYMRQGALSLNGEWQILTDDGSLNISEPEQVEGADAWYTTRVPGTLLEGMPREEQLAVRFAWARRDFNLSVEQAARDQLLRWGMIRHGATVWLNGQFIGEHTAIGPAEFFVPRGVLKKGANRILLKVPGWSGVAKNKTGKPLIPTGAGPESWGNKMAQIHDDIWIDFYDSVCLRWILAKPDLEDKSVTFRIWPEGPKMDQEISVSVQVRKWRRTKVQGSVSIVESGSRPFDVKVPIEDVRVWGPESPWLYTAEFDVSSDGKALDSVAFRFGMRELTIVDGRYVLNGEKTRFFGSNLVCEWDWNLFDGCGEMIRYLYDEARSMNFNCFRTHTCPPPARFANVADEVGTMIFAEFPLLYNYKDFQFTPSDYQAWHNNGILDATGWVTKLWNHPSIVMWVLTNESKQDVDWESGTFRDHVRALDPTRPAWRSGGEKGLDEIEDYHICENMSWYAEGRLITRAERFARERDPAKPLGCSEYMNFLDPPKTTFQRLLGGPDHPYGKYMQAEHCIEHTEVLRQLRYDLILPYMYAGWTGLRNEKGGNPRWRDDWPTPMSAALYSSFSRLLAGFDLPDRHFSAGATLKVPLVFINDGPADSDAEVDLYLTPVNPLFTADSLAVASALLHKAFGTVTFKADTVLESMEEIDLPEKEGLFYLLLVTRLNGKRPAVSQRMLHLADPELTKSGLNRRKQLLVLGGDESAYKWLGSVGASFQCSIEGKIDAETVLIWSIQAYQSLDPRQREAVSRYVRSGGRVVVMGVDSRNWQSTLEDSSEWPLPELVRIHQQWDNSSRAHAYQGISHPVFSNMIPEGFWRFNGPPNKSSDVFMDPASLPDGTVKILWMENPDRPVLADIPKGAGWVLVNMLYLKCRLDKSLPHYDPFAERIMLNLLFGESPAQMKRTEYLLGGESATLIDRRGILR